MQEGKGDTRRSQRTSIISLCPNETIDQHISISPFQKNCFLHIDIAVKADFPVLYHTYFLFLLFKQIYFFLVAFLHLPLIEVSQKAKVHYKPLVSVEMKKKNKNEIWQGVCNAEKIKKKMSGCS